MPFAARQTDLEIIILSEVSQRQISYDTTYMWNLKYDTNELIYKTEIDSQTQKTNLWSPKGKGGEREIRSMGLTFILYIKQINNKDLLCSTGNYIQYRIITYNGKESGKKYIYMKLNHFAVHLKHCKSTILQFKKRK